MMTNYETFKERLNKFGACGIKWGVKNGEPVWCDANLECRECELYSGDSCCENRLEWLDKEYIEHGIDWSKVPVDAKILVRESPSAVWLHRYFAKFENRKVFAWEGGSSSWSVGDRGVIGWKYAKLAEEEE